MISRVDQTCSLTKLQAGQPSNRGSIPGKGKGLLYPYMGVLYLVWNDEKMWGGGSHYGILILSSSARNTCNS
jgi:hypothetical protein